MAGQTKLPVKSRDGEIRRWSPAQLLEDIQEEMARFQEEMARFWETWPFGRWEPRRGLRRLERGAAWTPRMDVFERGEHLIVKAELPGIKKEDVEVSLEDGDLVIRGEHKAEAEVKEEDYYRMERSYGSFYRRLPLPFEVTAEKIEANLADGVLEVRIPKPAEVRPRSRKIPIK